MRETYDRGVMLRDLEWVIATAEHGHVTDTAAVLQVSQPTLSRAIARVEEELGARIFERTATGVTVTPDGERVVEAAEVITGSYRALVDELHDRHDPESGVARLAFLHSLSMSLVPQLLQGFHRVAPGVRLVLRQEPTQEVMRDLMSGDAELGIVASRPEGDFGWHRLRSERLVVIVPPTHRLAGRDRVRLRELGDDQLITTQEGLGYRDIVNRILVDERVSPQIAFQSGDLGTIEGLVSAGLGYAVVPEHIAGKTGSVRLDLDTPSAHRTIGVVWRTDHDLPPAARRLLDHIVEEYPADEC